MTLYRVAPIHGGVDAIVEVPGSKSIANRALVCAALASGRSVLHRVPDGDDTAAMVEGLGSLGIGVERDGDVVTVEGGRGRLRAGPLAVSARLAGTTSRFLTAVAAVGPGPYTVDGHAPLRARPMLPLHEALLALGARLEWSDRPGHLPVTVSGPVVGAPELPLSGDVSSQFLSALMLIGPCIPGGLRVALTTALVSRPYVLVTAAVMRAFGIDGIEVGERFISVPEGTYRPTEFEVEPDASSASYPLAAAAVCGGRVRVPGLTSSSMQGDAGFCRILERMGCTVWQDERETTVLRNGPLRGVDVDMVDMSDLVPTLAVVAPYADGEVAIHGVGFIRHKESDRIGDLCAELRTAGVDAEERSDGLLVRPGAPRAARLGTHHDHRLAMSFAVLGLGATGIVVEDPDVVSKSWPDFWSMIEGLR